MIQVLLADDEEIFLEYMKRAIQWEKFGCKICACCENGVEALQEIERIKPEIAFLDISMPCMSGLEVCSKAAKMQLETVLVLMSAHDEFSFAQQALRLEVMDYFLKPFTEEELISAVLRVLEKIRLQKKPATKTSVMDKKKLPKTLVEQIEEYLQQHYWEKNLNIMQVASSLQFENSYLRRVYKRKTGKTIGARIDELRILRAKELLEEGTMLNRQIAEQVGYADPYYFSRRFKELCGVSPTEYQNELKSENYKNKGE